MTMPKPKTSKDLTGMSGEEMAQALVAQGWTWDQVRASYPELFGTGGSTVPVGGSTALVPDTPDVYSDHRMDVHGGDVGTGVLETIAGTAAGLGIPAAGITAAGLGAIAGSAVGTAALVGYGISQALGLQYPWETGLGEGFIAPWTEMVRDEQGLWVTAKTRPDLFGVGLPTAIAAPSAAVAAAGGIGAGAAVVKTWSANGWPFAMTSDGRIHTVTKSGIRRSWKPYKSVVLGKNPSPRMVRRAVKKIEQFDKVHEQIKKMVRRFKT